MRLRFVVIPICAVSILAGCAGSSTAPSAAPLIIEGTLLVPILLEGGSVVNFQSPRDGTISASADWTDSAKDIDILLFPRTCSILQIAQGIIGCLFQDIIGADETQQKPAVFSVTATESGAYTLAVRNFADAAELVTYRIEIK